MGHPLLQQVAAGSRPGLEQVRGIADVEVARQQQRGRGRVLLPDPDRRPQTFVGVCRWQLDVHERDVGRVRRDEGQQRLRVAGLADHLDARGPQQLGEPGP